MNPLTQLKTTPRLLITLTLLCFALLPRTQAVVPPPDGGYPNRNTAEGDFALFSLDTELGSDNTAIGFSALYSNEFGSFNTASGSRALYSNIFGGDNTATGVLALYSNIDGFENTATGNTALLRNTSGNANTATGIAALQSNTTGSFNVATGGAALVGNITGNSNTAIGDGALFDNETGSSNTALGVNALLSNKTASDNTATGFSALQENTTGRFNTATGVSALSGNVTGNNNTANGVRALSNSTTGSRNIALGVDAGLNLITGGHNIFIGNPGFAADSNKIRIGTSSVHTATFIAGIRGITVPSGLPVVVGPNGQLGTMTSSARFKDEIKPMDKASEAILALKPVTFHYKKELDPDSTPQFGLVAEDVEKVDPALVARDTDGKAYTVRYDAVNAMLLNEFLKEHHKNQEQEATIARLEQQVETLTAGLKKVSAQIELSKSAPQTALNNQ